jgi:PAS domain S-box-containing protein
MIGYWDRDLRNRLANGAYSSWFGVDPAQIEGMHIREVIGDDLFYLNSPFIEAALRGERQQFERAIPSPDRLQIRHTLAEYIPDVLDGEVLGFYLLVTDVTSIKNADYALREAQKLGGVGSFCLNIASDRWTSSEVLDDIFGIDAGYVRDVNGWVQRLHPDERDELLAYWQNAADRKTRFDREYRVVRASDGTVRWVHSLANFICDERGDPVQFIGSVQDITERKRKDDILRNSTAAIWLRDRALSQISQGVIITDTDLRTTYVNEEFLRITGYSMEEMLWRSCSFLRGTDSQPEVVRRMHAALNAGQPFHGEIVNYRRDGTAFWNELSINPVYDHDGRLTQFVGVMRDITQRKQAALDLAKAKEAAEAANVAKSLFLSTISHELRTPMNGVLGMAQLLQRPGLTEERRMGFASAIIDSGKALLALIDDILDLSTIEAGKFPLSLDAVNPELLLRSVETVFSETARTKNLSIECHWSGTTANYAGDSRRIRQMLSIFVSNAIKFTSHGGILIEAEEIECDGENALLEFSVRDTGVGIAQDKLHLLFESFSQVDSSSTRSHGGSGLGLSIVRKLAELMNGEVGVESKVGLGSRFWFCVRLERA